MRIKIEQIFVQLFDLIVRHDEKFEIGTFFKRIFRHIFDKCVIQIHGFDCRKCMTNDRSDRFYCWRCDFESNRCWGDLRIECEIAVIRFEISHDTSQFFSLIDFLAWCCGDFICIYMVNDWSKKEKKNEHFYDSNWTTDTKMRSFFKNDLNRLVILD